LKDFLHGQFKVKNYLYKHTPIQWMSTFFSRMNTPIHISLPWRTLVKMTRPGFLVITAVACVLGTAVAAACGHGPQLGLALLTLLLAVLMHAAANVINDYHDALNGADEANTQGLFPFTGGARLIQNAEVTTQDTRNLAMALVVFLTPCGLWLAVHTGGGLVLLGLAGLLLGWGYSAPPLALMTRGLGEVAVALAWGLVVVGADYVQRGQFFVIPAAVAVSFALLVGNILVINGVPDAQADAQVGKRTLVVRLGARGAAWVYLAVLVLAHAWLVAGAWLFIHPEPALWGLVSLPLSLWAFVLLYTRAVQPARLVPAIVLTIVAAVVHGVAMSVGLFSLII
jgi:1,4-dihydroxy-2-naphthoate octaprenyltransferase